ncbi:PREDICTED: 26S proteasome non-ATPase regulatory subunit 8 isoform X2 [Mandrillus leucophaeus]|uniref:26S proteasome non-ATPase regulatory subunit 8 isoform X2 n=1 Tax=Mandrillus leucophaeus TaxID=9568 RepID=UPI0005F4B636|nr:PREDICTED: 26S proteasome non-ATPase regulatory subunit 8 isoform X2 [Mandrillus leucophaeus]
MFIKGRAPRAPPRERQRATRGGRRQVVAPPRVLGSTSRPHFRRASVCRRRCRKSGGRLAASRNMAAAAVNGAAGFSNSGPAATSGAVLQAATGMYEQLKGEWNRKSPNLSKCGEELGRLKLVLLELNFLPTTGTKLTKQQLILARDILEIGAQWSILRKDIQTNVYIKHPVSLEQYLMEGSYNKVFLAKGNIPAESYTFFIDILLDTIRDEIAGCIEKAYEKILFTEATRILFFNTPKKMTDYAKKVAGVQGKGPWDQGVKSLTTVWGGFEGHWNKTAQV